MADAVPRTMSETREVNQNILHSHYAFKADSPLRGYIKKKRHLLRWFYTLAEVLTILKEIIRDEEMFDMRNPAIILCDQDLEKALGMKALHVTQIREQVYKQLTVIPSEYKEEILQLKEISPIANQPLSTPNTRNEPINTAISSAGPIATKIEPDIYKDKSSKFLLKPLFRQVLSILPNFDTNHSFFTFEEVTALLCEYIDLKRESIIDPRNKKLAIVKNDPLGEVFNVDAFHKDQTTSLLKKQLMYVADANESDNLSDISENDNESASEFEEEEYSMESMEEEIRPFQSKTSSGDSEPDSQQTLNLLHEKITDTENSADHEDNTTIEDENFCKKKFEKKTKKTSWTCIGCPAPKPTWGWYCVECWRSRQEWLPKRKKLPYKTRRQRNKLRESRVNVDVQYTNSELCLFCCTQPKNTSFIHGKTGHQVCCYACAKNHWKKKATCPLCRLKIEKIVKIFTS